MPLLPKDVNELKAGITKAVATINNANAGTRLAKIGLSAPTVLTLNIFEHSMKNLRLQAFRIYLYPQ